MLTAFYTQGGNYSSVTHSQAYASFGLWDPQSRYTITPAQDLGGSPCFSVEKYDGWATYYDGLYNSSNYVEVNPTTDGIYLDFTEATGRLSLTGGDMGDVLRGGANDDQLYGGLGNDVLLISPGNDYFDGGDGMDALVVRGGTHVTFAPQDGSVVNVERIVVQQGTHLDLSLLSSSVQLIRVAGGIGADVTGTQAADRITGGGGADVITGGAGGDLVSGGAGADTFVFNSFGDFGTGPFDRIQGFSGASEEGDKIDLSALGFTGLHDGDFQATGVAQLKVTDLGHGRYGVGGDINGDSIRDFAFFVQSNAPLTADDFILSSFVPIKPPTGTPDDITAHHAFLEAFYPHDIAALV